MKRVLEDIAERDITKMNLAHLFIPSPNSKNRAQLLRPNLLASYAFLIFSLIVSNYFIVVGVNNVLGYATNVSIDSLLGYTNTKRTDAGLNTLTLNSKLSQAAEKKALDMFTKDYWAHISPEGKEPWDFIVASGYDYTYAGENLAVDFGESKKVVEAWYNSPSHRDNLLNSHYTEIGFAVVNGELQGRKTTLVVQMFGRPRSFAQTLPVSSEESSQNEFVDAQGFSTEVEEERVLVPAEVSQIENMPVTKHIAQIESIPVTPGRVLDSATVFNFSRLLALILGFFLTILFAIDGYFVRKFGTLRISGHTLLHILILVLAMGGIWYTNIGLVL